LFLDERDFLSALTLAGAAEALIGDMLKDQGKENSLESNAAAMIGLVSVTDGASLSRKDAIATLNEVRDWLKHYKRGVTLTIDAEEAASELLDRAVVNWITLTNRPLALMDRFDDWLRRRSRSPG